MEEYETRLADYISVLQSSFLSTSNAEDRTRYQKHLASAALMFAALKKDKSVDKLRDLLEAERRSYGWSYLSDDAGAAAETAFNMFADYVDKRQLPDQALKIVRYAHSGLQTAARFSGRLARRWEPKIEPMIVNGLQLPEALSDAIAAKKLSRDVGCWELKELRDSYGNKFANELGEAYESVDKIEKETGDLNKYFESDGVSGEESEWSNEPGFIDDIRDFSKIICFGMSADGSPFCLDYRESATPCVIWWDDVYWRKVSASYDGFINLSEIDS